MMELVDNLDSVDINQIKDARDWNAKYRIILRWGGLLAHKSALRQVQYNLSGCEASTWLALTKVEGKLYFVFDSESTIIRGLAVLLLKKINGTSMVEINRPELCDLLLELGLQQRMTQSRSNGFFAIIQRMSELIAQQE